MSKKFAELEVNKSFKFAQPAGGKERTGKTAHGIPKDRRGQRRGPGRRRGRGEEGGGAAGEPLHRAAAGAL